VDKRKPSSHTWRLNAGIITDQQNSKTQLGATRPDFRGMNDAGQ
jgi:hypothetical protein